MVTKLTMYLDCFYQYVVIPLLPPQDESPGDGCDDAKACLPAAAAGSLTRALEHGHLKSEPVPVLSGKKADSSDCMEIAAAAAPSISRFICNDKERLASTFGLATDTDMGNKRVSFKKPQLTKEFHKHNLPTQSPHRVIPWPSLSFSGRRLPIWN